MQKKIYTLKLYQNAGMKYFYHDRPQNRMEENKDLNEFTENQLTKNNNSGISNNKVHKNSSPLVQNQVNDLYKKSRLAADKVNNLEELKSAVKNSNLLAIQKTAINTVFADGNPDSEIMLIGEAPGANEDKQGIPFCGQSGKLLDNILLAVNLDREKAYISNTVFWRPPGNRRPTPEEINICKPFVEKHVALINPKLIILVGSTAVESLLNLKAPVTSLRKRYFEYNNCYLDKPIKTSVIFHPSYLLRQPQQKKVMWFDILKIKKEIIDKISR